MFIKMENEDSSAFQVEMLYVFWFYFSETQTLSSVGPSLKTQAKGRLGGKGKEGFQICRWPI